MVRRVDKNLLSSWGLVRSTRGFVCYTLVALPWRWSIQQLIADIHCLVREENSLIPFPFHYSLFHLPCSSNLWKCPIKCVWGQEKWGSSQPHGRRRPYKEPSRSCSNAAPWSYARSYSFLHSSSSLVLLCLLLPSGESPSKYGGEWLIPPYIGINLCIGSQKMGMLPL